MDLPDACVVYFENTKITPDHITFRLNHKTSGRFFDYDIRVFKMEEQSLESLEQRKLLLLLPASVSQGAGAGGVGTRGAIGGGWKGKAGA